MAKRDGGQHEKEAQNWGGAGQQEEAKPTRTRRGRSQTRKLGEMVRTTNDTDESGRKQELQKKGTRNRNKTRLVWFTVHECMRNRLKLRGGGRRELATGV
ncbi:hypothetical protein TNCV_2829501 [Trichonephila clavipes]|nr:hypothetical protein TNCV_2829501 [Trichonephila clavipes]